METESITHIAALIADPTRAEILLALMDGEPKCSSELAAHVNVTPATASHHLSALVNGGVLQATLQGRSKFYKLSGYQIAELIELLGTFSPKPRSRKEALTPCRSCYDHLAGKAGVALRERLELSGYIRQDEDRYAVTAEGARFFCTLGIDIAELKSGRRPLTRACIDWTERVPHLGGALGAALFSTFMERRWIERGLLPRQVVITPVGKECLHDLLVAGQQNP